MAAFVPTTVAPFVGTPVRARAVSRSTAVVSMSAEKSASLPFLSKPAACDGSMVGDVGFDPLAISSFIDIKWLRESELKHGRICMLAALGFIVQEFAHLPGAVFSNKLATEAFGQVPSAGLAQIFIFCGLAEFVLHKGKMTPLNMHADGAVPGALGFDPLNMKKAKDSRVQLQELKNGRLAMIAVGGFIHQQWIFKQGVIEQLTNMHPMKVVF